MTKTRVRLRYSGSEEAYMAHLFIGIKGMALAIDRATGHTVWQSLLKGGEFVNVVLDGDELYAATRGEVYRLDPATGKILWKNELRGLGWGLVTFAQASGGNWSAIEEKNRQDQAAAAATTAATT
jgi:outer membrane protein assembly factor BamB